MGQNYILFIKVEKNELKLKQIYSFVKSSPSKPNQTKEDVDE